MAYRKRRRHTRRPKVYRRKYRKTGLKRKLSNSRAYLFKRWVQEEEFLDSARQPAIILLV